VWECIDKVTGRIYFGFQEWCLILHWCQIMSVPFGFEIDKKKTDAHMPKYYPCLRDILPDPSR
jgi:hypothetical protein